MSMNLAPGESWRAVVGYEGLYEVSSTGRVRSLDRTVRGAWGGPRRIQGKELRTWVSGQGYTVVEIARDGKKWQGGVHILVCEAWHGARPPGMVARHLDDVKSHVSPDNLAWGTVTDNAVDAVRNRRNPNVVKTHCANGHEYTTRDTSTTREGHRRCRQCRLVRRHQQNGRLCSYEVFCDAVAHQMPHKRTRRRLEQCRRGHSMADAYVTPSGARRMCRTCINERAKARV